MKKGITHLAIAKKRVKTLFILKLAAEGASKTGISAKSGF
jgi:hypothetical protein